MKICKVITIILAAILIGCSDDMSYDGNEVFPEIQLTRSQEEVVNSHNEFAFDLFRESNNLEIVSNDSNILISPFSMAIDLSMLANGATDETMTQLKKLLYLKDDISLTELNDINSYLVNSILNRNPKLKLVIANSFWYGKDFHVLDDFKSVLAEEYDTECTMLDFNNSNATQQINDWCSKKTGNLIRDIFKGGLPPNNNNFFILNALYFEEKWFSPFDPANTKKHIFMNHDITPVMIDMMNGNKGSRGAWNDDISVVDMAFANGTLRMYCILPNDINSLDNVISDFNLLKWKDIKLEMMNMKIEVSFPKFKFAYDKQIDEAIYNLGFDIYHPSIGNMSPDKVDRIHVMQNSKIELDENGAKVATVSNVNNGITSASPLESGRIVFDRPFFFIIEEASTSTILFMGKINAL